MSLSSYDAQADCPFIISRRNPIIPSDSVPVLYCPSYNPVTIHSRKLEGTHLMNLPFSSLGGSRTIFAITSPGSEGFNNLPSWWSPRNLLLSLSVILAEWTSRSSRCISVSTTPGLTDMLVTSGSSQANCPARWFIAALVAPYALQVLTAPTAAPEEVKRMHPLDSLRSGSADLA